MANQRNSLLVLSKLRKSDQLTSAFHLHTSHPAMVDLKLQKLVCINLAPTPTPSPLTQLKLKAGQNLWKADQQLGRPQLLPPLASAGLTKLVLASSRAVADGEGGRKLETQQLVVPSLPQPLTKDILLTKLGSVQSSPTSPYVEKSLYKVDRCLARYNTVQYNEKP